MEPGHIDREDLVLDAPQPRITPPQWSPVISTGKTLPCRHRHSAGARRRNGARSYRPGRPLLTGHQEMNLLAAMEPGHIDREDSRESTVTRSSLVCRNGARSYRPGRPLARFTRSDQWKRDTLREVVGTAQQSVRYTKYGVLKQHSDQRASAAQEVCCGRTARRGS